MATINEYIDVLKAKKQQGENEAKRLVSNGTYELAGFYSAQAKAIQFCIDTAKEMFDLPLVPIKEQKV